MTICQVWVQGNYMPKTPSAPTHNTWLDVQHGVPRASLAWSSPNAAYANDRGPLATGFRNRCTFQTFSQNKRLLLRQRKACKMFTAINIKPVTVDATHFQNKPCNVNSFWRHIFISVCAHFQFFLFRFCINNSLNNPVHPTTPPTHPPAKRRVGSGLPHHSHGKKLKKRLLLAVLWAISSVLWQQFLSSIIESELQKQKHGSWGNPAQH